MRGTKKMPGAVKMKADPRAAHMADRKNAGQSYRQVASEFGNSASTVHRKVSGLATGFKPLGSAKA